MNERKQMIKNVYNNIQSAVWINPLYVPLQLQQKVA